jgi:prolyl oligopeptidase
VLAFGNFSSPAQIIYPDTRTTNQVDFYHGISVADPYRWLEDDNSPETKAWVAAQNAVTFDHLKKIPQRDRIRKRLTRLWNFVKGSVPSIDTTFAWS